MKEVGNHFAEQGEDVDFLWCSSDPDSLDGIVLKKRRIALLDGTAPHVVDPQNPGAVDEILNLGEYWVSDEIRAQRGSNGPLPCFRWFTDTWLLRESELNF